MYIFEKTHDHDVSNMKNCKPLNNLMCNYEKLKICANFF